MCIREYVNVRFSLSIFRSSAVLLLDRCHRLTHVMFSFSATYLFFVDRFGRCLWFCHLKFDKVAISDGCRSEKARYRWRVFEF